MELVSLIKSLPEGPGWAIIALVVFVIFSPTGIFSKKMAEENLVGISRAAQWWQGRKQRAIERDRQVEAAELTAVNDRLDRLSQMYAEDRERWAMTEAALRESSKRLSGYLVFISQWAQRTVVQAAGEGLKIDPPPTYEEWLESQ